MIGEIHQVVRQRVAPRNICSESSEKGVDVRRLLQRGCNHYLSDFSVHGRPEAGVALMLKKKHDAFFFATTDIGRHVQKHNLTARLAHEKRRVATKEERAPCKATPCPLRPQPLPTDGLLFVGLGTGADAGTKQC